MNPTLSVPLGRSGLTVTQLGLGTAPLGGLYEPVTEGQALDTVARAWELGIRFYDTAPLYGYGLAERRLAAVLRERPRSAFVIATKVGRLLRSDAPPPADQFHDGEPFYRGDEGVNPVFDFSYEGARRSLEESMERLGLDHVDVVHVHDPDDHFDEAMAGACQALFDLREEGIIGAVGVGMNQWEMLVRFARAGGFDCFLLAGRYTLLDQGALDEFLPTCSARGIAVIAGGVYNSGILADPRPGTRFDYVPAEHRMIERARAMQEVCSRYDVPLKAAAIQFPARHPAVVTTLTGVRSPAELKENVELFSLEIPDELWQELIAEDLLRPDAPLSVQEAPS